MNNRVNRNAVPPLTFLFSLLPGAGHMYLGLMRRGLEIMFAFFASIFILSSTLGLTEIGIPLTIIIFFYSLFDAQHLNKAISRGEEVADVNFVKINKISVNGYHMGIGAIVIGLLFLVDRLSSYASEFMPYRVYNAIDRSITPLLIMALGLYLIMKSRKTNENKTTSKE